MINTYHVPEQNIERLKAQIAKLASRCRRVKIQEPILTIGEFEDKILNLRDEDGRAYTEVRRIYTVTLESEGRPKIEGYEFAGVISPTTDDEGNVIGNVLRQVPGFEGQIPAEYREASNYCDHCKTRRMRLETFLIHSEAGYRQIGRNCLGYYLGLTDPERYANIAEILIDLSDLMGVAEDEGFGGGSGRIQRILLTEVLETAASVIRLFGWLSNKSAREFEKTSTSSLVRSWIFGSSKDRKTWDPPVIITEADKALAAKTIEWMGTIDPKSDSDYMYNLSILAKAVSITGKNMGIAVSAINAYSREMEFQIRRNARIESDTKSQFVGTPDTRMTFENVLVLFTTSFETDYGVTHMYKMKMGDNVLVYFASNDMEWEQGQTLPKFDARIKKHEQRIDKYNPQGVNQTIITRVKVAPTAEELEAIAAAKAAKKAEAKVAKELAKFLSTIAWG